MDTMETYSHEPDSNSSECNFSGFEDEFSGFEDEFPGFEDEFSGFEDEISDSEHNSVEINFSDLNPTIDHSRQLELLFDTIDEEEELKPFNIFMKGENISLLDSRKEELGRELTPSMAMMMTLPEGNDNHPDVLRLSKWLAHRKVTIDEFNYVVGPLQREICSIMNQSFENYVHDHGGFTIMYVLRAAAEALAVRCVTYFGDPYLTEQWQDTAFRIFGQINEDYLQSYKQGSNKLSSWIIHALGSCEMILNQDLRLYMLFLYKGFVKIVNHTRKKALESLMYSISSLDRYKNGVWITIDDISDILILHFTNGHYPRQLKSQYLYKFSQKMAENVKAFRANCSAGGVSMEWMKDHKPKELIYLIGLVKYISDVVYIDFVKYRDDTRVFKPIMYNEPRIYTIESALSLFLLIVRFFKEVLQDPLVIVEIGMCVLDVLEAVVHLECVIKYEIEYGAMLTSLKTVNDLLSEFRYDAGKVMFVDNTPLQQEIHKKHIRRVKKIRKLVTKEFLNETPMIYYFLHGN